MNWLVIAELIFRLSSWIASSATYRRNYNISGKHLNRTNSFQIALVGVFFFFLFFWIARKTRKCIFRSEIRDNYDDGLRQNETHWKLTSSIYSQVKTLMSKLHVIVAWCLPFSHRMRMRAPNKSNCQQQFCVFPTFCAFRCLLNLSFSWFQSWICQEYKVLWQINKTNGNVSSSFWNSHYHECSIESNENRTKSGDVAIPVATHNKTFEANSIDNKANKRTIIQLELTLRWC